MFILMHVVVRCPLSHRCYSCVAPQVKFESHQISCKLYFIQGRDFRPGFDRPPGKRSLWRNVQAVSSLSKTLIVRNVFRLFFMCFLQMGQLREHALYKASQPQLLLAPSHHHFLANDRGLHRVKMCYNGVLTQESFFLHNHQFNFD